MRDYKKELEKRVAWIQALLAESGAKGIVYGNSGGKDSALAVARAFDIPVTQVDLTAARDALLAALGEAEGVDAIANMAKANINPRLRMATVYAVAQTRGALVCGTGNKDEAYMGYFTKWGDGAYDFNPIGDLTVTEIYEFLRYLGAPASIIEKAPSAGLFEGQTDEKEMGVTYVAIEKYMQTGEGTPEDVAKIQRAHAATAHKRAPQKVYGRD